MADLRVAVIGMAGRFPKAANIHELWDNLVAGRDCATSFSRDELLAAGQCPAVIDQDKFVAVRATLDEIDCFDAEHFGYSPREAQLIDPQHRLFLETVWAAFEDAGYVPDALLGPVGVFAGCSQNSYYLNIVRSAFAAADWRDGLLAAIGNQSDFLATRVAYKLNLRGPAMTVQTACSTSLVAIHLGCQSLLAGECDMAVTGGAAIRVPQVSGQMHYEGGIYSSDGHCRAYSRDATGVFSGNGVAAVILKRFEDAIRDRDHIHAVIRATAINNDGRRKVGFTAPSEDGQVEVIHTAQALGETLPADIGYVEGHGTGTPLGDQIEIAALRRVFDGSGARCAIGSVKGNLGHLDAAAGVTGFIKACLVLRHRTFPPQPYFAVPNTQLGESSCTLFVPTQKTHWDNAGKPRIAAVSSLGLGGTNAHAILEEAPTRASSPARDTRGIAGYFLLPVSARTATAADEMAAKVVRDIPTSRRGCAGSLADVSATLLTGRKAYASRVVRVLSAADCAPDIFAKDDPVGVVRGEAAETQSGAVFMFAGGGAHYPGMASRLFETDPLFRRHVEACDSCLESLAHFRPVADILARPPEDLQLTPFSGQTSLALVSLFVVQYALGQSIIERGVPARAMIGHSLGEYVAATLAGTFTLSDALRLVLYRAELMEEITGGGMLSVYASVERLNNEGVLSHVDVAAINAVDMCTLSGSTIELESIATALARMGIETKTVPLGTPAHSRMLEPVLPRYRQLVESFRLQEPTLPWVSNVTGVSIKATEATDPAYWVRHLRSPVHFASGVVHLLEQGERIFLEAAPGRTLSSFVRAAGVARGISVHSVAAMRHARESYNDGQVLATAFATLWSLGVVLDPTMLYDAPAFNKMPLPTYAFARRKHWLESPSDVATGDVKGQALHADVADWFNARVLLPSPPPPPDVEPLVAALWCADDATAALVARTGVYSRIGQKGATPRPSKGLLLVPETLVGPATNGLDAAAVAARVLTALKLSGYDGIYPLEVTVLVRGCVEAILGEAVRASAAAIPALLRVAAQERTGLLWTVIDVGYGPIDMDALRVMLAETPRNEVRALRGNRVWRQSYLAAPVRETQPRLRKLVQGGVYIITGGVARVGLHLGEHLARHHGAGVALLSRRAWGDYSEWRQRGTDSSDPDHQTFRRLAALHDIAAGKLIVQECDVSDPVSVEEAFLTAETRLGRVTGVLHAAAVTTAGSMRKQLAETTYADFEEQLTPKLLGAIALEQSLAHRDVEFCLLFSSNASPLGGLGLGAYAVANAALEVIAENAWQRGDHRWVAATWDGWRLDGEGNRTAKSSLDRFAMRPEDSRRAFDLLVERSGYPVAFISKGDLKSRLLTWVAPRKLEVSLKNPSEQPIVQRDVSDKHAPPRTECERAIAEIWRSVLGVDAIGVDDSFFVVGGHSLQALRCVSRIRERFGIEFHFTQMLELETIAKLAAWLVPQIAPGASQTMSDVALAGPSVPAPTMAELIKKVRSGKAL